MTKKRILAWVLTMFMMINLLPMNVLAEGTVSSQDTAIVSDAGEVDSGDRDVDSAGLSGVESHEVTVVDEEGVEIDSVLGKDGTAVVKAPGVAAPKELRYMWSWRLLGHLKNDVGLPLAPFRIRAK